MTSSPSQPSSARLGAFRYRDYTIQWIGQLLSLVGTQMQIAALNLHVYTLLHGTTTSINLFGQPVTLEVDKLGLGALGLVRVVPVIVFGLYGGMVADTTDRRQILIWSQVVAGIFAGAMAFLSLTSQETIAWLFALTSLMSAVTAFSNPARQALVANLVPRRDLSNAMSLNNVMWQTATIAGPPAALLAYNAAGPGMVYLINALSFGAMLIAMILVRYRKSDEPGGSATISRASLVEGIRFTFDSRVIRSTMMLDFLATFFSSAQTMLPAVVNEILHLDRSWYFVLSTAQSVGAVLTAVVLSLRKEIERQGVVLLVSVIIYGLATALFGLSSWFALSYFLYAATGAADTVSTVIRSTLRQVITPDHLRGRMTGVNMIFFNGGPQLGELEAGLVASIWGVPLSIISGGILTVVLTALIAWQYPTLRNYMREGAQPEAAHA